MYACVILFLFGLAIGSFLNVVSWRYDGSRFLLSRSIIGGRSRCPQCNTTLRWYELIPLFSFVLQRARCRTCGEKVSFRYPIVELISGAVFVLVPYALRAGSTSFFYHLSPVTYYVFSTIWILAFVILLLIALIDLRLHIIPDEATIFLGILGVVGAALLTPHFSDVHGSFMGSYALLFGGRENIWLNRLIGAFAGALFLGLLVILTRGRGMGMGDVKLAGALGILFGWPDVAFMLIFAFIVGSLFGVAAIVRKKTTLKSAVPFGPFLAIGAAIVFFFGKELLDVYFSLFGLV